MHSLIHDKESGIHYRKWAVPDPRAVFLLVHGLGAHSERWRWMAEFMTERGISSYALELKGFGEANGVKGHVDSLRVYFDAIDALSALVSSENPGKKIFVGGESLGGLISFLAEAARPRKEHCGLVCVSPSFRSALAFKSHHYVLMALAVLFAPRKHFKLPFNSSMCTRDEKIRQSMEEDHREHRTATARLLWEIARGQMRAGLAAGKMLKPVLFLQAGEDKLVDPAATRRIFAAIKAQDKKIIEYPGMYHALTIDSGREKVFEDIMAWIDARL